MQSFKDRAIAVEKASKMKPEELEGRITIGVLADIDKPNYTAELEKIRAKAQES